MASFPNNRGMRWGYYSLALFFSCVLLTTALADPRTPINGEEVLQTLSISDKQVSVEIKRLRQQLNTSPDNAAIASQLATAYIQIARSTSDIRYYGYARATLKPWWEESNPPDRILFLRAVVRQYKHQYQQAEDDLKALLKQQPQNSQAWLTLSTIQMVQGDYPKARAGCSALARTASAWLSNVCHSQVLSLTGAAERAFKLQQMLALQIGSRQAYLYQWILGLSAETAIRLGKKQQAEKYFKQALALPLRDAYLLRTYSDYLLYEDKPKQVLALLKDETQDDALLLRLTVAAQHANETVLSEKYQKLLLSRYKAASLRGSQLHQRDEALFLLEFKQNDKVALKRALDLAINNWKIQKEPDDALILLRAARVNQSTSQIKVIRDWISTHNLQDQRLKEYLQLGETVLLVD
jgi:predicted Zn-dependent protease